MTVPQLPGRPTEPGVYYFRDSTLADRPDAYYLCIVNKVRDGRLGLYAEPFTWQVGDTMQEFAVLLPQTGYMQLILSPYPKHKYAPLAEFTGTWWGPLPWPK